MKTTILLVLLGACYILTSASLVEAQPQFSGQPPYQPLNQATPPGVAGQWAGALGRADMIYYQPVLIKLPGGGKVTVTHHLTGQKHEMKAPAQAGFLVGPLYRFRISNIPEFPGVELYPSIELIDRLHPPAGLKQKYPVPIEITEADIAAAMNDLLVTKVIYLEQPDLAIPRAQQASIHEERIPQSKNLITEADLRGRPVVILRLGGRIPSPVELLGNPLNPPAPIEINR
ncbi:MAG: hypothetical protein JKY95_02000 [Planctomycetaceae bacterium]|nr:hypothetical protein [Planctomycetaceae bacterium]